MEQQKYWECFRTSTILFWARMINLRHRVMNGRLLAKQECHWGSWIDDLCQTCLKRRPAQELMVANKIPCRARRLQLLERYPAGTVNFWFTDEKILTVAMPSNTQNDRLYIPAGVIKKNVTAGRLRTRPTFLKSVVVSVGVSSLGKTSLHFSDPGEKTRWTVLSWCATDEMSIARDPRISWVLQLPAGRGSSTSRTRDVELLKQTMPDFIPPSLWPQNSPDLNPLDYAMWWSYKSLCTSTTGSRTWKSCASVSRNGTVWTRKWLTTRSVNGASDWQSALQPADILNIHSEHYCICSHTD